MIDQRHFFLRGEHLAGFSLSRFLNKASGVLQRLAPAAGAIGGALGISGAPGIVSGAGDILSRMGFGTGGGGGSAPQPQYGPPALQSAAPGMSTGAKVALGIGGVALLAVLLKRRR